MEYLEIKEKIITLLKWAIPIGLLIFIQRSCLSSRCVYREDVLRDYRNVVNVSNGVSKKEGGIIAQYELVKRGTKYYFLNLFNGVKSEDENNWLVTFQPFADGPEAGNVLDVCVAKRNGEITCWNKRPWTAPLKQ